MTTASRLLIGSSKMQIAGMPPVVFAAAFIIVFAGVYLDTLPNEMAIGFAITMTMGGLLDFIGRSIPGFHRFGGSPILCILTPAVLVYFGLFPDSGVEIVGDFFSGYSFVDFLIASLIVGSLLGMDRDVLVNAGARFAIPLLAGVLLAFGTGALVGWVTGFGVDKALLYVVAPIMGGGVGAGAIPMSEIYGNNAGASSEGYISLLIPAIIVGNLICIFVAATLHGLGQRSRQPFRGFSGAGSMMQATTKAAAPSKGTHVNDGGSYQNLSVGLIVSITLFSFGHLVGAFVPDIHPYAWMIIATALLKIFDVLPEVITSAADDWYSFGVRAWIPTILVAASFGVVDIDQILKVLTEPAYLGITVITVLVASVAAGTAGWLVSMHYVEASITAGLCMADVGGSGDVAVLGASDRMNLMAFAQISSRLGGALILLIMSLLAPLLL